MDILDICHLLAAYANMEESLFTELNDVGFPLARLVAAGACIPTQRGVFYIGETWAALCAMLGVDPSGIYTNIDEMLEA